MRRVLLLFVVFSLVFSISSCIKRGEEDPFLSIYKRETRLVKNWKLKYLQSQIFSKDSSGIGYVNIRELNKGSYVESTGVDTATKTVRGTIYATLLIDADGSYTFTEDKVLGSKTTTNKISGKWSWDDKVKKGQLIFTNWKTFDVTGLWDEKLILSINEENTFPNGATYSSFERWQFEI